MTVNINDLRQFDRQLTEQLVARPTQLLPAFEEALSQFVASLHDAGAGAKPSDAQYLIGAPRSAPQPALRVSLTRSHARVFARRAVRRARRRRATQA